MLEVAVWPPGQGALGPGGSPFYLELGGETRPHVDRTGRRRGHRDWDRWHDDEGPSGPLSGDRENDRPDRAPDVGGPVYQYSWTLGHPGDGALADPWWHHLRAPHRQPWNALDDPAARVYLYFPTEGGWRVDELAANLTYLAPVHQQESMHNKAADDWSKVEPVLTGAGEVASKLAGVAGLGPVAAGMAPLLAASAKLQINRVPASDHYAWTVAKVATRTEQDGFFQGIMWTVPRQAFTDLGGRLTGTLAVTVQASSYQGNEVASEPVLRPAAALASAVILHDGRSTELPGEGFVRLIIDPRDD